MDPLDLERTLDHALRQLPRPHAPHTLLPRVMAAARRAASRPWYSRAWLTWPRGWRVASAVTFALLVAALGATLPHAHLVTDVLVSQLDQVGPWSVTGSAPASRVAASVEVVKRAVSVAASAGVVWDAVFEPLLGYVLVLVAVMCAACVACGVALNRVAFGEVVHQ